MEQSGRKGTGGTHQTADDGTAVIFILTGDRRAVVGIAPGKCQVIIDRCERKGQMWETLPF